MATAPAERHGVCGLAGNAAELIAAARLVTSQALQPKSADAGERPNRAPRSTKKQRRL